MVGYFLRSMNVTASGLLSFENGSSSLSFLDAYSHYRLLPGDFSYGSYHFDGLATVMKIDFHDAENGFEASFTTKPYESQAYKDRKDHKCVFFGTGEGKAGLLPTDGVCFRNPGVNLFPIDDQLWLTIDTSSWGRVDRESLDTVEAKADVHSLVLNAHPACDAVTNADQSVCYVQHPCPDKASPYSKDVCVSTVHTSETNLETRIVSKTSMNESKIIQHSHSPCVTEHFVVSKLDAFVLRDPLANLNKGGLLEAARQGEDNQWLVMDRDTNVSRILRSTHSFVNNHFWNCVEDEQGNVVVETVTATKDYLDNYFAFNLKKSMPTWSDLFHDPLRCVIPTSAAANEDDVIKCDPLLSPKETSVTYFDYPTYNPLFKMNRDYRFTYAIAPSNSDASRWFDSVIKIDRQQGVVVAKFERDGLYMTEADFVPRPSENGNVGAEDDGILVTIAYDSAADSSSLLLLDASDLTEIASAPFGFVVPFHAHGISCQANGKCWTNP